MASDLQQAFGRQRSGFLLTLQERLQKSLPTMSPRPKDLHDGVRQLLMQACRADLLKTGLHEVSRLLSPVKEDKDPGRRTYAFSCGPIDYKRRRSGENKGLVRSDGAVLSFSLTLGLRDDATSLDLLAYRFDLTFPSDSSPSFIRFDMDPPGKPHEKEGLRAHIHPGLEDVRLPSPVLHPLEVLSLLLVAT